MSQQNLDAIRQKLLDLRQEHLSELRRKSAEAAALMDEGVPDAGDASLTDNLREHLHLLGEKQREELLRIDEALDRIQQGDYGTCDDCGEVIDAGRIEARPFTRYCVTCKEEIEKDEARRAGTPQGTL